MFLDSGTTVFCLKHVGISDSVRDRLEMSVNTLASWSGHVRSTVVTKSFENDTNIYFHKVCCLSLYDGNLHILQNVMKSDQMNCNSLQLICHANDLNPPKTFPLHFSPATKGPADIISVILSLTGVEC